MLAVFANRKQLYNQSAVGYDCEITLKIHNIRLPVFAFQLKSETAINRQVDPPLRTVFHRLYGNFSIEKREKKPEKTLRPQGSPA